MSEPFHQPEQSDRLVKLPPGQQLVAAEKWPYVGERQPLHSDRPWSLQVEGLVNSPQRFSLEQLAHLPQTEVVTDIHCVTRWSKLGARFSGVSLRTILKLCQASSDAKFISFVARTQRQHSSSLRLDEAIQLDTLLATHYEGQPLTTEHGGPLRGVVSGKYFYKSVKWIERVELLAEDRPGYWESATGYHNNADPWKEQRYIAASISRREAASLIESRIFAGRDLRSIDVSGLDLSGLDATEALLRNAQFEKCQLSGANFGKANLSNANLRQANLTEATFRDGDLEGADLSGADLRGADLSGCSLSGASFCDVTTTAEDREFGISNAAKLDSKTKIDRESLQVLPEGQRFFLERFLSQGS